MKKYKFMFWLFRLGLNIALKAMVYLQREWSEPYSPRQARKEAKYEIINFIEHQETGDWF